MREQFQRVPYNHLIKKINICNISLAESEDLMYSFDVFAIEGFTAYCCCNHFIFIIRRKKEFSVSE